MRGVLNRRTFSAGVLAGATLVGQNLRTTNAREIVQSRAKTQAVPADPIALGLMVEIVQNTTNLDQVVAQIGREPAIVMFHTHWGNDSGIFNRSLLEFVLERGVTPLVTWEPWRPLYAGGLAVSEQPDFALRTISAGQHDAYIESWADGIAGLGEIVMIRFGHEMNGDWYPWGIGVNGNTAADFVDAWRYLHEKFEAAGAFNVRWVWTPIAGGSTQFDQSFPGDDYVDYVGMSGFNWGTTQQAWGVGIWQSFEEIFTPTFEALQNLSDKPIIIAEMASAEQGGDKAAWITDSFLLQLPLSFPEIRAVVWFNIVKETDWRIDSSPESLRAFVTVANSAYLSGELA
ncbi:hypothetical protein BH23CHL5_BH23CHL5_06890 [soil metagenome]